MGYFIFCNEDFLERNIYQDSGVNIQNNIHFEFCQYSSKLCNKIILSDIRNLGFSENE